MGNVVVSGGIVRETNGFSKHRVGCLTTIASKSTDNGG
jgi:hypothetical protein